jgi:benzoate/toluate 1,2-dioxygenase reductase component
MTALFQGDPSRLYEVRLVSKNRVTEDVFDLVFERAADFTFSPGQRIRIVHEKGERDYTPISSPKDSHLILLINVVGKGLLSPVLAAANIGTPFFFTGPHGYFVWLPSGRPAVFVATGTGVAPFISMASSGVKGFIMVHGAKSTGELYKRSLLRGASEDYVACISDPSSDAEADVFRGRVTDYIAGRLNSGVYDFYLCGQRDMIQDVTIIVDERFPGSSVYAETFY